STPPRSFCPQAGQKRAAAGVSTPQAGQVAPAGAAPCGVPASTWGGGAGGAGVLRVAAVAAVAAVGAVVRGVVVGVDALPAGGVGLAGRVGGRGLLPAGG